MSNSPGPSDVQPNKLSVRDAALALLGAEHAKLVRLATETKKGATHVEAKAENDKDTRGLEMSYLARGQAMRVEEVDETIKRLRFVNLRSFDDAPIDLGAMVRVLVDDKPRFFFLVPAGGGTKVRIDGVDVALLSPASPVGRALLEKYEGDDFEISIGGHMRLHEIDRVW